MRLNNILAAGWGGGGGELDPHPHHNFGIFIDPKISLKKVQSILYTMIKEKNPLLLLAVANFPGNFS